jgi:hypothetical protein
MFPRWDSVLRNHFLDNSEVFNLFRVDSAYGETIFKKAHETMAVIVKETKLRKTKQNTFLHV